MLGYRKKRKTRSRLYSRPVLVILIIASIVFAKAAWNIYQKKLESERGKEKASAELVELEKRQQELSLNINLLKTKTGIEKEIRDKFSIAKEGEKIIVIVEPSQASTTESGSGDVFQRVWHSIKSWFGGN